MCKDKPKKPIYKRGCVWLIAITVIFAVLLNWEVESNDKGN